MVTRRIVRSERVACAFRPWDGLTHRLERHLRRRNQAVVAFNVLLVLLRNTVVERIAGVLTGMRLVQRTGGHPRPSGRGRPRVVPIGAEGADNPVALLAAHTSAQIQATRMRPNVISSGARRCLRLLFAQS